MLCLPLLAVFAAPAVWAARDDMRFTDVYVESETDMPRACFEFTQELARAGDVRFQDYVRFEPEFAAEFTARGRRLCVSGMEHGRVYAATLLAGLPAVSGRSTRDTERFNVSVPDREPSLSFRGSSYILPSRGERVLPVESVNVAEADVRVLRINDRNLIGEINQGRVTTLLSRWDADRIATLDGETVWQGVIELDMQRNRSVPASIPIGEMLGQPEPGIYIVMAIPRAERSGYVYNEATQWMVVTDIGISSFAGEDGLHVFLRSLQDAKALAGTRVQLIARSNEVLGEATTGPDGRTSFDPGLLRGSGGARPAALMAFGKSGEFSFLDMTRPAFDLTDRGVGGRPSAGPIDGFVYTERGVYRPGETVHIVSLLRDERAMALRGMPAKLRILRPDGAEHDVVDLGDERVGGYHFALPLSKSARTGGWTLQLLVDPEAPPVGAGAFQVEDFVPERMAVELSTDSEFMLPDETSEVDVSARFLYGAPGAGLTVESEMVLLEDGNPYPDFHGYRFGLVQEEWRPRRESFDPVETDAEGQARLVFALDGAPDTTRPLKARMRVSVAESGGRAVSRTLNLPVRALDRAIGIRARSSGDWLEEGQEATFDILALDRDGVPVAQAGLSWELFREEYRYHWYRDGASWRYKVLIEDSTVDSGSLDVVAETPAAVSFRKDWGRYRLEVSDPASGAATSVRFQVGWFASASAADVPDKLAITLDRERYRAGDVAKIHVRPPFAGALSLIVAGARVYETRNIEVPAEGTVIELPVRAEWDAGAYVVATLFRTAETGRPHQPARAIGLAWLARDFSDRTLAVNVTTPERIQPRRSVDVELTIAGVKPGEPAHVTLAAVDIGILQLTDYRTPDPAGWYFGKRRLGMALRDGYGHLIAASEGGPARIRQGGDEAAEGRHLGGLDASSVKTVSLFSGILPVGDNGRLSVPLAVPDFNGRLQLVAVAWTASGVGSGEAEMIVRDPVVSQVTLPRFLAPDDAAQVTVSLHNVDGPTGGYRVAFSASGAVAVAGETVAAELAADARRDLTWRLNGEAVGVGGVTLSIEGPDGLRLERNWEIAVRPAQARITRQVATRIRPRERRAISADVLSDFVPGTGEATIAYSTRPDLGLASLLKRLDRYPYGCAEQTTSRALPLLYVAEVAASLGIAEDAVALRARVERAVRRVLTMQRSDGSFGMWRSTDTREEWLTAYVMDFLTQAKELGYPVPEYPYGRGLKWLEASVDAADYRRATLPARAYALYVLARAGKVRKSDLRYVHDVYLGDIPTALGRAQLGAALALTGDDTRAASAFAAAERNWDRGRRFWDDWWFWDYGTQTRDMAATVYLASLSGVAEGDRPGHAQLLAERVAQTRYLSTQEQAWLILAARELGEGEAVSVSVGGRRLPDSTRPVYLQLDAADFEGGVEAVNHGEEAIWQTVTWSGVPAREAGAETEGFQVSRAFYRPDGRRADLDAVRQGETLVAVITGQAIDKRDAQVMVVDLLPAGFEIENDALAGGRDSEEFAWLPQLTLARYEERRDDRYVAAFALNRWEKQRFAFAYTVRAVSPGEFRLPAAYVEDMYQPVWFGRSAMGTVTVLPPGGGR